MTSSIPPSLSGPQYNWEGDLNDLSCLALTSSYVLLAKAFHGNGFDVFSTTVALAAACCPRAVLSCEDAPSMTVWEKTAAGPIRLGARGGGKPRAPVSQGFSEAGSR